MGTKIEVPQKEGREFAPSATIKLTEKEGNYISGNLLRRFESTVYKGKYSYLVKVTDLEGRTVLYDKATKTERDVDVKVGDAVFVKGTTYLDLQMNQVSDGADITIAYTGKGKAKKGQRAPFQYDVEVN